MNIRIGWEFHENPSRATFHCDRLLPSISWYAKEKDTEDAKKLRGAIESINGIEEVATWKYRLSVKRGGVFSWSELCPVVEEKILEFLGCENVERVSIKYGM